MRQGMFIIAVVVLASFLLASFMYGAPRPTPKADKLTISPAIIKADRIANAFAGMPPPADPLDPIPIRVIPISRQAVADPATPALLTRIATADPMNGPQAAEEPSHAVSEAPRRYTDVCAAHGMRKIEFRHGWRCIHGHH